MDSLTVAAEDGTATRAARSSETYLKIGDDAEVCVCVCVCVSE